MHMLIGAEAQTATYLLAGKKAAPFCNLYQLCTDWLVSLLEFEAFFRSRELPDGRTPSMSWASNRTTNVIKTRYCPIPRFKDSVFA